MPNPVHVVFVCTGNICRSPSAHAVLETWLARELRQGEGWPAGVVVESAGTGSWHAGELPTALTRAEGKRRGHTVEHRARVVRPGDFDPRGLVVAMGTEHRRDLLRLAPAGFDAGRVVLFRSFDPDANAPRDVEDPYYGGPADFVEMFDVIERCMPALLARVRGLVLVASHNPGP
ncbi:MAG: low molecular weight protein-tyrosine-phosphatase [Pseudomonadota bacterium]|nr:low molecular weight protein-tyrosine-phosphatase [Pseudomonadota bacterium]